MKVAFLPLFVLFALTGFTTSLPTPRSTAPASLWLGRGGAAKKRRQTSPSIPKSTTKTGATIPNEVFNLVKAIVGVGVLSLPAGVAAFANTKTAVIPAITLIVIIGILSGYGFALIGKVCAYTGATSYRDAWTRSIGETTSWIPAWSATLQTFLACLAFSMVLADTFCSLLGTKQRTLVLLGITAFVLLPLCWKKDLRSLAPFSLVGVLGMLYTGIAMTKRLLDGTYRAPDGPLLETTLPPSFGTRNDILSSSSLVLVCMLSTAYMAHFNAPKFYLELQNNTLARFYQVVTWSFGVSIFLSAFITAVGYLTFGGSSDGLILNNYSRQDVWMWASRVAVAVALVCSYPLVFQGCRDGVLDGCKVSSRSTLVLNASTVFLLLLLTLLASLLKDVSFVLAFGGATLGNLLTYVYPTLMYQRTVSRQGRKETLGVSIAVTCAVLGVVMGLVGSKMALDQLL